MIFNKTLSFKTSHVPMKRYIVTSAALPYANQQMTRIFRNPSSYVLLLWDSHNLSILWQDGEIYLIANIPIPHHMLSIPDELM